MRLNLGKKKQIGIARSKFASRWWEGIVDCGFRVVPKSIQIVARLDRRMSVAFTFSENLKVEYVKPTILHRLWAEWQLSRRSLSHDVVLCFGNLPPLFSLPGFVQVFCPKPLLDYNVL